MTERKRRSEDGQELNAQPPPSLAKKRHTAKESDFEALSTEFDENAGMLDLDAIREFQKEAIWRQMQEYKRDAQRAQQRSSDIELRHAAWEQRIAGVCAQWDRAVRDLDAIVNDAEPSSTAAPDTTPQTWLEIMLPRQTPSGAQAAAAAETQAAGDAQTSIERFNESVNSVLRQLQTKSKQSEVDWQAAIDRLSRTRATQADLDELKAQVALLSRQLSESKEVLEQREFDLRHALKQLDRRICPTVRNGESSTAGGQDAPSPAKGGETTEDQPMASPTAPTSGGATPAADGATAMTNGTAATSTAVLQAQQDKENYKLLAERRLAEIEEKVRENTELLSQVDSLKLQIAAVPDYVICETSLYKQAEASRDYYLGQTQRLQVEVERLFGEISELKTSRAEFEEGALAESTAQRQALEAELQRLQNDLARVRNHRDQVQRELEARRAQDGVEDQKSAELKLLSDVRRERMNALISENKRLLACIAVLRGDRAAFETYTDEELSKTTAVADELRSKLEQVTRREKRLADQLEALSVQGDDEARVRSPAQPPAAGETESARLLAELQGARDEVDRLQLRICKYEEILGGAVVDESGSIVDDTAKASELAAKQKRVDEMALERDGLARTSAMMERELQIICESFAKLEEQNTSKVWDLSSKEQAVARVVAEKSKYDEKFIGLNKDCQAQRLANQALRNQNAKQLEHIKAIEERDRALAQQLSLVGSEAEKATQAWQATQARLQDAQVRAQELEEQARALEEQVRVATQALNERTESLGALEHEKRRVQETLDAANRRLDEAEKTTDHSGLSKLCADYKALLKCPTCQTNFKSHVLLRCMHVFCKQCIDSRIETRQRKCPSCSEPFGAKDVRQIYL
ncbi:E3 ubiquitin-protein ligase bre1 [Coemansia sp. RSA 2711]|nr:E3 ubiquitin-protein ligase bre1 [Coemansia sp. RSA 2711]